MAANRVRQKDLKAAHPPVSVVILNWNGLEDTKTCLKHVRKSPYKDIEIIIVDNGSTDGSVDYLRKQEDIILVENKTNRGFTGGHIDGLAHASGEYILLLNNDAALDPAYIEVAASILKDDNRIGAVGGRAYFWNQENKIFDDSSPFYSYQTINPISGEGLFASADHGAIEEVNVVSGSAVMIPRKVIQEVGYLHNRFFAYYEETDLFARMKRAGYRIVYSPDLKIWHRNGVSSQKKSSTFSYYMMMRNRFSFAVRNFERQYLWRFLKNYTKTNLKAFLRAVLYAEERPIHLAYTKAFLYNLAWGWRAFVERALLKRKLGVSLYNQQIIFEQSALSVIVTCKSKKELEACLSFCQVLRPMDELVVVSDREEIRQLLEATTSHATHNIRLCFDSKLLATNPVNLGAICAQNDWLILPRQAADLSLITQADIKSLFYEMTGHQKKMAVFKSRGTNRPEPLSFLKQKLHSFLVIHRSEFIDAGGIIDPLSASDGLRALCLYGVISKQLMTLPKKEGSLLAPYQSKHLPADSLLSTLTQSYKNSKEAHKNPGLVARLSERFYRLFQLRNLVLWLFSARIPLRLKLARLKNLAVSILKLNLSSLATELKHIRNEVLYDHQSTLELKSQKVYEAAQLKKLLHDHTGLAVFIICRDRLSPLKQLIPWLEKRGFTRIVFIDNDSAYPPLLDYLSKTPYQVLSMKRNIGHTVPWSGGIIKTLLPNDFYIVTDPDVIPTTESSAFITHLLKLHQQFPHHLKIGPGLKIDDLPDHYALKNDVVKWESQFWNNQMSPGVYEAGLDTTFALYKPYTYSYFIHPSLRTGEPYTARHLPWYNDSSKLTAEDIFYRLHADASVNTWDKDSLPERYKKELAKQKTN